MVLVILVRYLLKEHIAPFLAALFVITFLFVVDFLVNILDSVLSKGLPWGTVLEIFALNLAWMLSLSVPMAVLVACLMAFGRLSGDLEITAIKAAGVSPFFLLRPILLVATLLSTLLILFNNWILPEANHRSVELMSAVSRKKPHAFVDAGRLITQFPGVQLWVNRIDPVTGKLYDIQIFETDTKGAPRVIIADSASMDYVDNGATLMLRLRSGENHLVDEEDPGNYFRIRFFSQDFAVKNVDDRLERRNRNHRSDREMPVEMMLGVIKEAKGSYQKIWNENKTTAFPGLVELQALLPGDSVVPPEARPAPADSLRLKRAIREISMREQARLRSMERVTGRLEAERKREAQYWVEVHKKFSTAFACIVFVLIGAPLGIMARKGGIGTGIIYSIAFFVIYWVSLIGGENLADRLAVPPALAMWFSNMVIGVFGLALTVSMIQDRYSGDSKFFRAIRNLIKWFGRSGRKRS